MPSAQRRTSNVEVPFASTIGVARVDPRNHPP
jgi:hypothetical protein